MKLKIFTNFFLIGTLFNFFVQGIQVVDGLFLQFFIFGIGYGVLLELLIIYKISLAKYLCLASGMVIGRIGFLYFLGCSYWDFMVILIVIVSFLRTQLPFKSKENQNL